MAPVSNVIAIWAIMFPTKMEEAPRVALLSTAQKTLATVALTRMTWLLAAVIRDDPISKIKTGFETPVPSKMRLPVVIPEELAA